MRWRPLHTSPGILDVVGPRTDGRLIVASSQAGLFLLRRGSPPTPFARGPEGYVPGAGESYNALARKRRLSAAGCSFRRNDVYALDPAADPGIIRIDRLGRARRFADLPSGAFLSGIAFDTVGRFGYRLLVTPVRREHDAVRARLSRSLERHSPGRAAGRGRDCGRSADVRALCRPAHCP